VGPPQSSHAGRRRGARGLLGRPEGVGDLGIGEVVAVPEHHGRAFGGRQLVREVLELAERVASELGNRLSVDLGLRLRPQLVHRDVRRDREDPRA
jgi:GNAT superfamily N-acetyltransferase